MGSAEENIGIDARLQAMIAGYLRGISLDGQAMVSGTHLDEDTLTGFAEGNLSMREASPVVNHLVSCTFCRHKTAELVRLEMAFEDTEPVHTVEGSVEPSKVSEVLSGILSRLFGGGESAVFAHEEKNDEESSEDDNTDQD